MKSKFKYSLFTALICGLVLSQNIQASCNEFPDQQPKSVTIAQQEFVLLEEPVPDDPYGEINLDCFKDVSPLPGIPSFEQVRWFDLNASRVIGESVVSAINTLLGRPGQYLTSTTCQLARMAGKGSLTELSLDMLRSPFKISADQYPKNMPEYVGKKLQAAIAQLVPKGEAAVAVIRLTAQAAGNKGTLTEVIFDFYAAKAEAN